MKILNREQIKEADNFTIRNEPISSLDLMERAAKLFKNAFLEKFKPESRINIFCGKGNNGGDGLVIARFLNLMNYKVRVFIIEYNDKASRDFIKNYERLIELKKIKPVHLTSHEAFPKIEKDEFIIDAIWGSGLSRKIEGFSRSVIEKINNCEAQIIAVDIASGTFCDGFNTDEAKIKATYTFSFQLPKYAFFLPENNNYVGEWNIIDIGINQGFINGSKTLHHYFVLSDAKQLLKRRSKFDHKGNYGHALFIAGSYGKIGAAVLGAKACLRSGAGILTVYLPHCGYNILQTVLPEAMVITDPSFEIITSLPDLSPYNALGLGPGIGTLEQTSMAVADLLLKAKIPLVIDADGINVIAANKNLIKLLPPGSILTPHIGELDRLIGKSKNQSERFDKAVKFAADKNVYIVIKGAYSAVICPDNKIFFNSSGNPGMATAGSGDVLTGIILSFLAQKYDPLDAALLGVYLHGLAGDIAAQKNTQHAIIARDIVHYLSDSFLHIVES